MNLINTLALDFTSPAVYNGKIIENFNFKTFVENNISILFFWPLDFTFVCPTELIALNNRYEEFKNRNVKIIGISIDSVYSHNIWQNMSYKEGGIGNLKFPLISDISKKIINYYNVLSKDLEVALRATFIIDQNYLIKHQSINDLFLGRNINEIIRLIDAILFTQKYKNVCPAQWEIGKTGINPSIIGIKKYLNNNIKDLN